MHDNIYFVLVKPVFLINIGSIARVMKNFGFTKLRLVDPPRDYKHSESRRMAVDAFDVLKDSEVFDTLAEALQDISLGIGTTSGQQRDMQIGSLLDAAPAARAAAQHNKVAIVFGDERNGLSRDDLLRCHQVMTIPTSEIYPALNLAQAVAVTAYELARPQSNGDGERATLGGTAVRAFGTRQISAKGNASPTGQQNDQLFQTFGELLDAADFSRSFNREKVLIEFRSFYQRAQPTEREHELLRGALFKIAQKINGGPQNSPRS